MGGHLGAEIGGWRLVAVTFFGASAHKKVTVTNSDSHQGAVELPIGLQLMARPFDESTMLRAAHAFEQETGIYKKKPSV